MSYPILYNANEVDFNNNGIGVLSDCVSCRVREVKNGEFELEMTYPVTGIHFDKIKNRSIIKAKPNKTAEPQLFRVYSQKKVMKQNVSFKAEHISYDLSGFPVSAFVAKLPEKAMENLKKKSTVEHRFSFETDIDESAEIKVESPMSTRSALGVIQSVIGGDFEFDNFSVKLHKKRGLDRGASVRYGKNLTDFKQEENCSNVFTAIYPYWMDNSGETMVELPEKMVNCPGTYDFVKVKTVNFSLDFAEKPSVEELREAAQKYIEEEKVGIPEVSFTISFAAIEQSREYENLTFIEKVELCDSVSVIFPAYNVSAKAEAVEVWYNVLLERVDSVTLGSVRPNIADTIMSQKQEVEMDQAPQKTRLHQSIENLSKAIMGAGGGAVRLLDTNRDGSPDELYIADDPNPAKATKVWRFNHNGWAASQNGYAGPFEMGASFETGILAEFITAGTLYGMLIKAGQIESENGKIKIDLSAEGDEPAFNTGIRTTGIQVKKAVEDAHAIFFADAYPTPHGEMVSTVGINNTGNGSNIISMGETINSDGEISGVALKINDHAERETVLAGTSGEYGIVYVASPIASAEITEKSGMAGFFANAAYGYSVQHYADPSKKTYLQAKNGNQAMYVLVSDDDGCSFALNDKNGDNTVAILTRKNASGVFCIDKNDYFYGIEKTSSGEVRLNVPKIGDKYIYWASDGNGNYVLKGTDINPEV